MEPQEIGETLCPTGMATHAGCPRALLAAGHCQLSSGRCDASMGAALPWRKVCTSSSLIGLASSSPSGPSATA